VRAVDIDVVAGGIADVELHQIAGKFDEVVAERVVVERASALGGLVHRLDVVDRHREVAMTGRLEIALEQVKLGATQRKPLHRKPKFGVSMGSARSRST
jgi:hypothetical protein